MSSQFKPSFEHFQQDLERFIIAQGDCEKTDEGMMVFHGYDEALKQIFTLYMQEGAYDALIVEFRRWNWEESYNDYLLDLTDVLIELGDWPRYARLWSGVLAKRRKLYNEIWKIEKDDPGAVSPATVRKSTERLLETLERVLMQAYSMGTGDDALKYSRMIEKVKAGKKA